jgi:spermidine synthase
LYFAVNGGSRRLTAAGIILFLLASVFGNSDSFAFWEKDIVFEGESVYNYLQVRDGDRATILSTNVLFGVQSIRMKQANLTGLYYDYALLAPVLGNLGTDDGKGKSVLVLGMGTGTFAQQTKQYFPEASVSGVEIDEKITDLAHRYFELPESIPVVTYDGRAYLNADTETYDVIMVDAYQDITIPFQMSSKEFFGLVKDHLKPGGVMVVNMNMYTDKAGGITDYLSDTISTQFSQVYTADVEGSTNRELFASNDESLFANLPEKIASLKDTELRTMMTSVYGNLTERTPGNLVFTDDKAPVELMGMDTIDGIIKDEIGTYKQIFKEKGLQGLFDAAA